jgi:hypothetical protein
MLIKRASGEQSKRSQTHGHSRDERETCNMARKITPPGTWLTQESVFESEV